MQIGVVDHTCFTPSTTAGAILLEAASSYSACSRCIGSGFALSAPFPIAAELMPA